MRKTRTSVEAFDFFEHAAKVLGPERMRRVEERIQKSLLSVRLAELREGQGLTQSAVPGFSQPSVSKLESREDVRLSTLTEYLNSLDYDLQIVAVPRRKGKKPVVLVEPKRRAKRDGQ